MQEQKYVWMSMQTNAFHAEIQEIFNTYLLT